MQNTFLEMIDWIFVIFQLKPTLGREKCLGNKLIFWQSVQHYFTSEVEEINIKDIQKYVMLSYADLFKYISDKWLQYNQ